MDEKTLITIEVATRILATLAASIAGAIASHQETVPLPEDLYIHRTAEQALAEHEKKS